MIRLCDAPSARADSTNGKPITSSTEPRTTRANAGVITMPIAIIALRRFGPSRPAITIASTSPGSANIMSTKRISSESTLPPKKPESRPSETPSTKAMPTEIDADLQRDLGAVDDARHRVAAELVGAHRVRPARILEARRDELVRVDRPDVRPEDGDEDVEADDDRARDADRVAPLGEAAWPCASGRTPTAPAPRSLGPSGARIGPSLLRNAHSCEILGSRTP